MTVDPTPFRLGRSFSYGFARVAAATFWTKPKGVTRNLEQHLKMARKADAEKIQLMAFPELGLSGYFCRDAFDQRFLQTKCLQALGTFCFETKGIKTLFVLGLPLKVGDAIYNVAAFVNGGEVLAFVPKSYLAAAAEWQEGNWFEKAENLNTNQVICPWQNQPVPIGTDILISLMWNDTVYGTVGAEICEDGWQTPSPGDRHAHNGADIIVNLSASNFVLGKDDWRMKLFPANSGRQKSAYLYVNVAGDSTSAVVWDGQSMIIQDGTLLATSRRWLNPWESDLVISDIDTDRLSRDRTDKGWQQAGKEMRFPYRPVEAHVCPWIPNRQDIRYPLTRLPFVPKDPAVMKKVGDELFHALAQGVIGRLWHLSKNRKPVDAYLGLSGGLDSALAFLVSVYAYDQMGWNRQHLHAVRLPSPVSSKETQEASLRLAEALGTGLVTIEITATVEQVLRGVGHEPCWDCLICENAQARVRTLLLKTLGFNLGTGDLSETSQGFCTEGGDQSSHFHVIANVPKTLVRYLVQYFIEYKTQDVSTRETLWNILRTRISPELRKPKLGEQIQSSEALVGPYELKDFFLKWMLRDGAEPRKIAFLAEAAFSQKEREEDILYSRREILYWLRDWYVRFDSAQFKRNAGPDSVLVGMIGLGAHDKFRWPSDGDPSDFIAEVDLMIRLEEHRLAATLIVS